LNSARQQSATSSYGALASSASAIRTVGPETVNGVPTVHYRLRINPAKEHSPLLSAAALRAMTQAGVHSIPADIWLDAQGRTVKITDELRIYGNDILTTITMGDFNQPVHVVAPPKSETSTGLSGLISGLVPTA
jgi:hypothetical protein